eukprot:CAMPEP_0116878696 /NCGR_PEP_ID=MMETSP0463-20121206/10444_1 /TAXON_ID=181622 /ORGANISM="Strombidinopsis sp, Strain SopsisLIS2011" /LENGTH=84 /DNA_ID=CAMNT_0004527171 /DNA_START=15 /DNA_END=266 /DNA_ORIENTATION=-
MIALSLPEAYPFVVLIVSLIAFQVLVFAFTVGASFRKVAFSQEFLQQFEKEHNEAFPGKGAPGKGGLPDNGNGYYARKLSYEHW